MRSYTPGDVNLCEAHVRQLIEDAKKIAAQSQQPQEETPDEG